MATKYNTFAALVNIAIYYATRADGWVHGKWGATGMLWAECSFGVLSALVFAVASGLARRGVPIGAE